MANSAEPQQPDCLFNARQFYEACQRYLDELGSGVQPLPVKISVTLTDTPAGELLPLPDRPLHERFMLAKLAAAEIRRKLLSAAELQHLREFEEWSMNKTGVLLTAQIGRRKKRPNKQFAAEYQQLKQSGDMKDTAIARRMGYSGDKDYRRFVGKKARCRKAGLL